MILTINWNQFAIFITISNLLNITGWVIQNKFEYISHIYFPTNIKDTLGMMFWNSLFQTLLFVKYRNTNLPFYYFFLILLLPRFLLYTCGPNCNELMEILNSHNGIQPLWIEPIYKNKSSDLLVIFLDLKIDRYVMYLIAISVQITIVYSLTGWLYLRLKRIKLKVNHKV